MLEPAYYAYMYPVLPGIEDAPILPHGAYFRGALGEFILPYDVVRRAPSPDAALLEFLQDSYEAAACEMIERTGSEVAPWVLVEANNKEWARVKVIKVVVRRMKDCLSS